MPEPFTDPNDMRKYSNALRLQSERRIRGLTNQLASGNITLSAWQSQMKAELRRGNYEQFITGYGGDKSKLRRTDYLKLGPELKRQYAYLRRFAAVIEAAAANGSPLTFAISRAVMYARSTQAMFWKSHVPVKLPQVPRDGQTKCRTNCKCRLVIDYERDEKDGHIVAVLAWWRLSPAEHCEDCLNLASQWRPLRLPVEGDVQESDIEQSIALLIQDAHELHPVADEIYAMWDIRRPAS